MLSFIAQRIVKGVIVLVAIIVLNFFLIRLAPGDPALVMAGEAGASDKVFVAQVVVTHPFANVAPADISGTMITVFMPWPRSVSSGGCLTRNVAITPSSVVEVDLVSRTTCQNFAVSNDSTSAAEAPRIKI